MESIPEKLVLYDGDCGFCNRSVAFILRWEKKPDIHFAAIQSEFTERVFAEKGWEKPDLNTFYFIDNGNRYERSTAALKLLKHLKAPLSWLRFFTIVPRVFRDWCYNQVAKRRQRISSGFCAMPTPEQRARFIR